MRDLGIIDSGHDSLPSMDSSCSPSPQPTRSPLPTPSPPHLTSPPIYATVKPNLKLHDQSPQHQIVKITRNNSTKMINRTMSTSYSSTSSNNNKQQSRNRRSLAESVRPDDDSDWSPPPPNIAPVSGVPNYLNKTDLVRPIAFRPVPVSSDQPAVMSSSTDSPSRLSTSMSFSSDAGQPTYSTVYSDKGARVVRRSTEGFLPGHPLIKDGARQYGSSQDLNRPTPTAPYNKFSSLDRRTLVRRHQQPNQTTSQQPNQTSGQQPNQIKLSTFTPGEQKVKSYQPERRHSSYNPGSSLHRTPSQNSEYRLKRTKVGDGVTSMNVNGLPEPFRNFNTPDKFRSQSVRSMEARNRNSGAGTPQFHNLSGTQLNRTNQGSLTNLNQVSHLPVVNRTKLRSDLEAGYEGSDEDYLTPSPSDSAVGDLETILKEKDSEISYLRESMEQNEHVIFKVYEEKEKMWEREVKKIKALYETRLKANQQKASKMEASLLNQIYQLQSEKSKLEAETKELHKQREEEVTENQILHKQIKQLRDQVEISKESKEEDQVKEKAEYKELEREKCELVHQLNLTREEVHHIKETVTKLDTEKKSLTTEINRLKSLLEIASEDISLQEISAQKEIIIERDREIELLTKELEVKEESVDQLKTELDNQREHFETETANWLCEKEKVIRYQKQLQLNYVSMYKRNKSLETELDQLKKSVSDQQQKPAGHVSSAKSKLFSRFSSKFGDSS